MDDLLIDNNSVIFSDISHRNLRAALDWCDQNLKKRRTYPKWGFHEFETYSNGDWACIQFDNKIAFWFSDNRDKVEFTLIFLN